MVWTRGSPLPGPDRGRVAVPRTAQLEKECIYEIHHDLRNDGSGIAHRFGRSPGHRAKPSDGHAAAIAPDGRSDSHGAAHVTRSGAHRATESELRNDAQHAGQLGHGAGLGLQSFRQGRNGVCGRAAAELTQQRQRVSVRRRLHASSPLSTRHRSGKPPHRVEQLNRVRRTTRLRFPRR